MALMYVSSAGSNTSPYDTWAKAATTLLVATAAQASDNDIYVLSTHTETPNVNITYVIADNVHIYSVNSSDVYTRGAEIDNSGGIYDIYFNSDYSSFHGFDFVAGSAFIGNLVNTKLIFNDCLFSGTGTAPQMICSAINAHYIFNDCEIDFSSSTTGAPFLIMLNTRIDFLNTTFSTSSTIQEFLHLAPSNNIKLNIKNCNFSGYLCANEMFNNIATNAAQDIKIINTILPPNITSFVSQSFSLLSTSNIELIGCSELDYTGTGDDNNSNWNYERYAGAQGEIRFDTTNYLTATYDGTNEYSVLLSSDRNNVNTPLIHEIAEIPASDLTTSIDITVNFTSSTTLTNVNIWLSAVHPNNTTVALGVLVDNRATDILGAGTPHTTNTEAWTGGGTNKYESTLTIPALSNAGDVNLKLYINVAIPSTDIWFCPDYVVT